MEWSIIEAVIIGLYIGVIWFWVWSLIDILKNDFKGSGTKIIWFLAVFFLSIFGSMLYYFIGRKQKIIENTENLVAV